MQLCRPSVFLLLHRLRLAAFGMQRSKTKAAFFLYRATPLLACEASRRRSEASMQRIAFFATLHAEGSKPEAIKANALLLFFCFARLAKQGVFATLASPDCFARSEARQASRRLAQQKQKLIACLAAKQATNCFVFISGYALACFACNEGFFSFASTASGERSKANLGVA
jgi:hypothetical protein